MWLERGYCRVYTFLNSFKNNSPTPGVQQCPELGFLNPNSLAADLHKEGWKG